MLRVDIVNKQCMHKEGVVNVKVTCQPIGWRPAVGRLEGNAVVRVKLGEMTEAPRSPPSNSST